MLKVSRLLKPEAREGLHNQYRTVSKKKKKVFANVVAEMI